MIFKNMTNFLLKHAKNNVKFFTRFYATKFIFEKLFQFQVVWSWIAIEKIYKNEENKENEKNEKNEKNAKNYKYFGLWGVVGTSKKRQTKFLLLISSSFVSVWKFLFYFFSISEVGRIFFKGCRIFHGFRNFKRLGIY